VQEGGEGVLHFRKEKNDISKKKPDPESGGLGYRRTEYPLLLLRGQRGN